MLSREGCVAVGSPHPFVPLSLGAAKLTGFIEIRLLSASRRVSRGCRTPNEVHGASSRRQHSRAASYELLDDPDLNASPRMRSCTCSS